MKYAQRGLTTGRFQNSIPSPASSLELGSELSQEPSLAEAEEGMQRLWEKSG